MVRILSLVVVVGVVIGAVYLMLKPGAESVIGENVPDVTPTTQSYQSSVYGLSFTYPDTYVLIERDEGTGERARHVIVLMDKDDAANVPQNGEGPTTITIDIFDNRIDAIALESWIKNTSASNYKLSPDQELASTSVSGAPGLSYVWDGLYRGESTVIAHKNDIVMFSVTYMDSTAQIRDDFRSLLSTVSLK